jgi:hypothetical protein
MRRWNDDAGYLHMLFMKWKVFGVFGVYASFFLPVLFSIWSGVVSYISCEERNAVHDYYHLINPSLSLSRNLTLSHCTTQHKHASIGLQTQSSANLPTYTYILCTWATHHPQQNPGSPPLLHPHPPRNWGVPGAPRLGVWRGFEGGG